MTYSEKQAREFIYESVNGVYMNKNKEKANGYGKYLLKRNGCLYWHIIGPGVSNALHHTALTKGHPVVSGGWILFKEGQVLCINPQTGHYRAGVPQLDYTASYLTRRGSQSIYIARTLQVGETCSSVALKNGVPIIKGYTPDPAE